jgi:hypothetical protein
MSSTLHRSLSSRGSHRYAFIESNILLAVVQIGWHAFVDEDDPSNDYVNSTTIVNGLNFTLSEE